MKIIDMHCDTIMALMNTENNIYESDNMIDLKKLQEGDYLLQCFAMFVPYASKEEENYSPFEVCNKMIDRYYQEIEKYPDLIKPAFNYQDIENNIFNAKELERTVKKHVKKYKLNEYNKLVLGCTHYELAENLFKKFCPNTEIINNSNQLINNINITGNNLNIVFMQSKRSQSYEDKIKELLRRDTCVGYMDI